MSSPALANRRPGTERFHPSAHLLCDGPHEHTRRETHDLRHDRSSPDARSMNRTASLEAHPAAAWAGVYPITYEDRLVKPDTLGTTIKLSFPDRPAPLAPT